MNKPVIEYHSKGESGNIYWLLSAAQRALRKQRKISEYNNLRDGVLASQSYLEALSVMAEHIDLIDLDK